MVREAQYHDVLRRLFPEVVINSVSFFLWEHLVHHFVEVLGGGEIGAERLLHHGAAPSGV